MKASGLTARRAAGATGEPSAKRKPTEVTATVSERVRALRHERGLSLRSVAASAQISPSLLSSIERGKAGPSLVSLVAIADALGVRPGDLLEEETATRSRSRVVRRSARRLIDDALCRREYLMHADDPYLEVVAELFLPPGGSTRPGLARHSGRDYAIVLEGSVTIELEASREHLSEGDYIAFDAAEPHRLVNDSGADARVVWIIAYVRPTDGEAPSKGTGARGVRHGRRSTSAACL